MPPKKAAASQPKILLGRPSNNLMIGIVGLPNVGKSTFFNVLTSSAAAAENYPFCTINPEEARVAVPDERFEWLCKQYKPASRIPAYLTVFDIAGLVKGASSGEGLGNAFLSHISQVDGIFHVVRAFSDEDVIHVEGDVDPVRDLKIIHEELRLKDIQFLKRQEEEKGKLASRGGNNLADKAKKEEWEIVKKVLEFVEGGQDVRKGDWNAREVEVLNSLLLLTSKPVIYLVNLSEEDYIRKKNKWLIKIKAFIDENYPGDLMIPFSGQLEHKLLSMKPVDRAAYLKEKNSVSALPKIIVAGYQAINLMYFFTTGADEVRAWTVRKFSKAPQAAGVIHSDFERGFIMAEVMRFEDLKELETEAAVKAAGKYLQKGKDYVVQDGDIIYFKFNITAAPKKK